MGANIKKFSKQIHKYEKAVQLNPNDPKNYINLSEAYIQRGIQYSNKYPNKAKTDYQYGQKNALLAYDLNPNDIMALSALGRAYTLNNNYKNAIQIFSKALEINPNEKLNYFLLAECYFMEKNYEKAIEFHHNFIKFNDPRYLGSIIQAMNRIENIASLLNQSIFPVPIDFTPLRKVIPIGEDIIYSTLAQAKKTDSGPHLGNKTVKYAWKSHVLITQKGMAYYVPSTKKKYKPLVEQYVDWYRMKEFGKNRIRVRNWGYINFFFVFENSSIPLIHSLIINRKKELKLEFPKTLERRKAVRDRIK